MSSLLPVIAIMKVHFASSTSELKKYKNNYLEICRQIKKIGHTITRDWIEEAIGFYEKGTLEIDREDIYKKVMESVLTSDVVVIEGTVSSFSVGHQITVALTKNKPILFLEFKESDKKSYFKNSFIDGIKSPLITTAKYNLNNLREILEDFFNRNKNGLAVKFNIVLTKEIDNYLDWASFTYKISKSEFIRKIIQKYMNETDHRYRKYLSQLKNKQE